MVNRILIRTKTVQILYSYFLKDDKEMAVTEKELFFSFEKAYELYHLLLQLMIEITNVHESRQETARNKYLATSEDKSPNLRLVKNRFVAQLRENEQLKEYLSKNKTSWVNDPEIVKVLLDRILASDIYSSYIHSEEDNYETDKDFWKKAFKKLIIEDEDLQDTLESRSLYWNDDLVIISTFILKTIKRFEEESGVKQNLIPMFKDDEDIAFARNLFRETIFRAEKNRAIIENKAKNWELDRVAFMDVVIMLVALAEIETFPGIPINVSLNEYIEIAKFYSTAKSGHFINGILDAAVVELKKEGALTKE